MRKLFLTILNTFNLFDSAALYSNNPKLTYFRHWWEETSARYERFYTTQKLVQGLKFKLIKRTGDQAPIEIRTGEQEIRQNWKFSDFLLSDPAFIQKLHDTIWSTLVQYLDNQEAELQEMQNHINLDINNSETIFGDIVEKVRDICRAEIKSIRVKETHLTSCHGSFTVSSTSSWSLENQPQIPIATVESLC